MAEIDRRRALILAAGATMANAALPGGQARAESGQSLLAVQWGAPWIDVTRQITAAYTKQSGDKVAFELHAGGAMAVVAKMRPLWPRVPYNLVSGWDPTFAAMIRSDWLEPVTVEELPVLAEIPKVYFAKDAAGRLMSVPLSTSGAFWGYREDLLDNPLASVDQLLEPRFKGKICVPYPVNLSGLLMLTLAVQRGGDERNIEPGWQFLKELASRGQIGRVINTNSEFIDAMSSGDLSVAFFNIGAWTQVRKRFPTKILSRLPDNKGFLFNEGFAILKGDDPAKVAAAKRLAADFATAANNEAYNMPLGEGPTNPKAKAGPDIADVFYTPDELPKYAYFPDYAYMSSQVDGWAKRWETEIVPLLRQN
jgi:putative spermidine/putrescine transport system substrate-binding protein